MHVRLQTWLPLNQFVCINGREWPSLQMDKDRIRYLRRENCFVWLEDPRMAQALLDRQVRTSSRGSAWRSRWSTCSARGVCKALRRVMVCRGRPVYVRSDDGPEFIARALMKMLKDRGIECRHITPGSPWQNGKNERFNGTLRSECTEMETFYHRDQARAVCELFRRHYNQERPHSRFSDFRSGEFGR